MSVQKMSIVIGQLFKLQMVFLRCVLMQVERIHAQILDKKIVNGLMSVFGQIKDVKIMIGILIATQIKFVVK